MRREAYVVYIGKVNESGSVGFYEIDSPDAIELGRLRGYTKKVFKYSRIGGIYKVEFEPDESDANKEYLIYKASQLPVALFKDVEQIIKWKTIDASYEDYKKLDAVTKANHLRERLEPIRQAYRTASSQGRKLILAEVIRIITG